MRQCKRCRTETDAIQMVVSYSVSYLMSRTFRIECYTVWMH